MSGHRGRQSADRRGAGIAVEGLSHTYPSRGGVEVLEDLDFDLPPGGYATITGPSGAGTVTSSTPP